MEKQKKNRASLPGNESTKDVLDFAAIANSIRPAGLTIDTPTPGVSPHPGAMTQPSRPRANLSWVWIAAGVGGALVGALGAIVVESQMRGANHRSETVALQDQVPANDSGQVRPSGQTETSISTTPAASAFVAVDAPNSSAAIASQDNTEPDGEPTRSRVEQSEKPSTVVSARVRRGPEVGSAIAEQTQSENAKPKNDKIALVEDADDSAEASEQDDEEVVLDLPARPSREVVRRLFEGVRADIHACAAGGHGRVDVSAKVGSSGRVKSAIVDGVFRGSPEGSCMARAIRSLRFPKFADDVFEVAYPYQL